MTTDRSDNPDVAEPEKAGEQSPKVFVSYAHENRDHKNWVKSLATNLRTAGIDALLDEWRVGLGEDFTLFMDEIRTCDRVLLICTPAYARKSNEGEGGVGYERSVITSDLAQRIDTSKFVCVLRVGSTEEAIPTFARSRRYIDFRDDSDYDVRLGDLLRDLHNAPADLEPPLGANPFEQSEGSTTSPRTHVASADEKNDFDPESIVRKAEILLSRKDMLGWKRLLRRTYRQIQPRLEAWRTEVGKQSPSDEQWLEFFNDGVKVCEPLFVLALTAVDSEIDSIRNQHALIDDLLGIEPWAQSGLTVVVSMPVALAYVYHHLLGAFLVSSHKQSDAIRLLDRTVRGPSRIETRKLWQDHGLMGWVESLEGNSIKSWQYIWRFNESRAWLQQFFSSARAFTDSLRAYVLLASMIELSSFLAGGGTDEQLNQELWLDVPPLFLHHGDDNGTNFDAIVTLAIPDRSTLEEIAQAGGTNAHRLQEAWGPWIKQLLRSLIQGHRVLAYQLAGLAERPPGLPS